MICLDKRYKYTAVNNYYLLLERRSFKMDIEEGKKIASASYNESTN